ncbi:UNKNOWN [Stylonychia lemnae]|uniref:Uncharacterized protein n=1 Tax=Stylonychia lemnae TaxID=5949 RepID=A0A078A1V1_STYLE|nr:UNKNOWN [Stylonychia lemnae]|eukprot:CDW76100.1 UNKNOWN [Stylonychia lemnae]
MKLITISTQKCANLVYNLKDNKLSTLNGGIDQTFHHNWGSCVDYKQLKFIVSQPNSTLQHFDSVQFQSLFNTTYKSKKIQNINFGHLLMIQEHSVISINPSDSLVLINTSSNKLLTYEKLISNENQYKFYYYDNESMNISLLGQRTQDGKLIYTSYEVMDLQTSLYFLISKQKIKNAIKLALQFKSLQKLDVLEPLLVNLFRKKQKQELLETKEYKVFMEMVKLIEEQSKIQKNQQEEVPIENSQNRSRNDDEGFGQVLELKQQQMSELVGDFVQLQEYNLTKDEHNFADNHSQKNLISGFESYSEVLIREKAEKLRKEQIKKQEILAKKLYKENKKISRKRKKKRFDYYIDNIFLQKLLVLSYQNNKPMLVKILVSKKMPRDFKLKLLWNTNDYCSLVYRMEKLKYQNQDYARQLINQKFQCYKTDFYVNYNGRLNTRYYLVSIILPKLNEALTISRVQYKLKFKIKLDAIDQYLISEYYHIRNSLNK